MVIQRLIQRKIAVKALQRRRYHYLPCQVLASLDTVFPASASASRRVA
jgi:hypothetical protein